jgi:hypothetical protein
MKRTWNKSRRSVATVLRGGLAGLLVWLGAGVPAFADEASAIRTIGLLELYSGATTAYDSTFYAETDTGWGAASCPGATWAYFYSSRANAKEMFALLMYAKQLGKQVQLVGTCASSSYFVVVEVMVMN